MEPKKENTEDIVDPTDPYADSESLKLAYYNILGGAGSYSAVGARIFSPRPLSKSVAWIVDVGSDFPDELREFIIRWETSCLLRETPERLTTRGWNGYGDNEQRGRNPRPRVTCSKDPVVRLVRALSNEY